MLSFLLGLIPGAFTTINGITNAIANERIAGINAVTEQDRIGSQERISTLQAQRDVLIADSTHSNIDLWLRFFIAIGPATYLTKIFLWDKVLQTWTQGSTDPLDPNLWTVVTAVVGFYFLYSGAVGVAKIIKA
jgi:hypothetical protein